MPLAFGAAILDGAYTKILTVTCLDNDPAADLPVDFTTNGMTDLPDVPVEYTITRTTSPDTANSAFAITAIAALGAGFTIRKLTGGGGANNITLRITLRVIHSVDR